MSLIKLKMNRFPMSKIKKYFDYKVIKIYFYKAVKFYRNNLMMLTARQTKFLPARIAIHKLISLFKKLFWFKAKKLS
jgi:DNA polymerase III delta prime subunit